jgi:hypothetical protein
MLKQRALLAAGLVLTSANMALAQSPAGFTGEPSYRSQKQSDRDAPVRFDAGSYETYAPEVSGSLS